MTSSILMICYLNHDYMIRQVCVIPVGMLYILDKSLMRKPDFRLYENYDADQISSNCTGDQRLCFRHSDSTSPLLLKSKISSVYFFFCDYTGRFVSDLGGNHKDRFSRVTAHLRVLDCRILLISAVCFMNKSTKRERQSAFRLYDSYKNGIKLKVGN